ncbi:MAG: MarR family transcriptional regulator [Gemmatimonadaceae bacterium]
MSIDLKDEIKQRKPFASKDAEALLSILRTATILEHDQNEALKPYGVTATQYNVLRILQGAGESGLCGRDIAERLISKVPDVSRLLDRMDDIELVTRERDPEDRRHVTARISAKGRQVLVDATPALEIVGRKRFKNVDSDAATLLIKALGAIRNSS